MLSAHSWWVRGSNAPQPLPSSSSSSSSSSASFSSLDVTCFQTLNKGNLSLRHVSMRVTADIHNYISNSAVSINETNNSSPVYGQVSTSFLARTVLTPFYVKSWPAICSFLFLFLCKRRYSDDKQPSLDMSIWMVELINYRAGQLIVSQKAIKAKWCIFIDS